MAAYCPLDKLSVFTGLMSLSRKIEKTPELYATCIKLTERFGEWLVFPEQAILDMAFHQLQIQPEAFSWDYAVRPIIGQVIPPSAHILHAVSQPKFWNGLHNETWDAHYSQWLSMGGSPWRPVAKFSWRNLKKKWSFFLKRFFR